VNWDILLKYINNESNASESSEVSNWLNEQAENQYLLQYLQKRKEQLQQPLKQDDIHDQWVLLLDRIFTQPQIPNKTKPNNGYWFMGIAASLLIVSLLGWFYMRQARQNANRQIVMQTPAADRGKVTLPDGSLAYLAPNSKLTYDENYGTLNREIHIIGEAFFNVKHNVKKPFVIDAANQVKVTVLGTSFDVYSRIDKNTEVKVATGLVGITTHGHTTFLKAGQQLEYQLVNNRIAIKPVEQHDAAALQNQSLFFKNNNVDEIAEKLQRWYNITVVVNQTAHKHPRFSGEVQDTGLDNVLQALSYATGIHYQNTRTHTIVLF